MLAEAGRSGMEKSDGQMNKSSCEMQNEVLKSKGIDRFEDVEEESREGSCLIDRLSVLSCRR